MKPLILLSILAALLISPVSKAQQSPSPQPSSVQQPSPNGNTPTLQTVPQEFTIRIPALLVVPAQPNRSVTATPATVTPSQAQIAACLATLPSPPKPPMPPSKPLFPSLQKKIDDGIRSAGGDPVAIQEAAMQAAVQKYQDKLQAYNQKRLSCSAPVPIAPAPGSSLPAIPATSQQTVPVRPQQ